MPPVWFAAVVQRKDSNCLAMLKELRAGRGMEINLFRESDWRKQVE